MKKQLFLWALLLFCTIPTLAHNFEVDGIYYNFLDGDSVEVTYKGSSSSSYSNEYSGSITIPAIVRYQYIPYRVTSIGKDAFKGCSNLTEITIGENVTSIGDDAFYKCSSLTEVTIPNSVTTIGYAAFSGCSSLAEVTIGNSVTTIYEGAFYECFNLVKTNYTGDIASWCAIDFWDGSANPISYSQNFYLNDVEVKELIIPDNVTTISADAFSGCSGLTAVTIPNSVTTIGSSAFYDCTSLTEITISENVTSIGSSAFYGCTSLTQTNYTGDIASWCAIDFWDGSANPISYSHNFYLNDVEVKELIIPDTIRTINAYTFSGYSSLTEVTIGNSITTIDKGAFYECSNLVKTNYTGDIASWCAINFGGVEANPISYSHNFYLNDVEVKELIIPDTIRTINAYTFYGCSSLTEVIIGNGITTIGYRAFPLIELTILAPIPPTINSYAFPKGTSVYVLKEAFDAYKTASYWKDLNVNILKFESNGMYFEHLGGDSVAVTYRGNYYYSYYDEYTGSVLIPTTADYNNTTYCVTTVNPMAFSDCQNLEAIDVVEGHPTCYSTGNCIIEKASNKILAGCKNSVIPTDINNIEIGTSAFAYCLGLTSIIIPDNVTKIDESAFRGCSDLTTITIPTSVTSIGESAFADCSNLTSFRWNAIHCADLGWQNPIFDSSINSVVLGDSVEHIPAYLCYKFTNLTSFDIPNSVTSIGIGAFESCTGLTSITIPYNVTSIEGGAFKSCSNVAYLTSLASTPPTTASDAFSGVPTGAEVTVPCNSAPNYRVATGWTDFQYVNEDFVYDFNVTTNDEDGGLVQIIQEPSCSQAAIIKALPMDGYVFKAWSDGNTRSMRQITVEEDINLVAYFISIDGSDNTEETGGITVNPDDNSVTFTWPSVGGAVTYVFTIYADEAQTDRICTLTCNAMGQLVNISFPRKKPAAIQEGALLNFTINGLDESTTYAYTLDSYNADDELIVSHAGNFTTQTGETTGIETLYDNVYTDVRKVLDNGTIYIVKTNGEKYTVDGRKMSTM